MNGKKMVILTLLTSFGHLEKKNCGMFLEFILKYSNFASLLNSIFTQVSGRMLYIYHFYIISFFIHGSHTIYKLMLALFLNCVTLPAGSWLVYILSNNI